MDLSRTALNTGTTDVRHGYELDLERLDRWMAEQVEGYHGPLTVQQFKGGQSNPTYKLVTPQQSYVLRRKPPGTLLKSAHAVDREYRVLKGLSPTDVPVPYPYALCQDDNVIGSWFYVMEFKPGRVFWDLVLPEHNEATRREIWLASTDAMARLHHADYKAAGLGGYGKPGNYFERQYRRWSEQYEYTRDGIENPNLEKLIDWLETRLPEDEQTTIAHGDLQFSNMMFHPSENHVIAILDWELSTLGNPLSDLAYFCKVYHLPLEHGGLLGVDYQSLGIPSEDELLQHYCDLTERKGIDNWAVIMVFSMFRLAAIRQGIAKRVKDGTAASEHAKTVAQGAVHMADAAWHLVQTI